MEDYLYHGVDVTCKFCSAPNSAAAQFCVSCCGDLSEGKQVGTLEEKEFDGEKAYTCDFDQAQWASMGIETIWEMEIGAVLGDARCGTLQKVL